MNFVTWAKRKTEFKKKKKKRNKLSSSCCFLKDSYLGMWWFSKLLYKYKLWTYYRGHSFSTTYKLSWILHLRWNH